MDWVKVGERIAQKGHNGYTGRILTISKVYKTGNFVTAEDSDCQFRPYRDGTANPTSRERYSSLSYHHVSAVNSDEVEAHLRAIKLRRELEKLLAVRDPEQFLAKYNEMFPGR